MVGIVRHNFLDIDRVLSATAAVTLGVGVLFALTQFALPPLADVVAQRLGHARGLDPHRADRAADRAAGSGRRLPGAWSRPPVLRVAPRCSSSAWAAGAAALRSATGRVALGETLRARPRRDVRVRAAACVYTRSDDVLSPALASAERRRAAFVLARQPARRGAARAARTARARPGRARASPRSGRSSAPCSRRSAPRWWCPCGAPASSRRSCASARRPSGDAYTPTDRNYLALIADKLGSELLRFDQQETLAASRALQARLRRYVPGTLADRLDRGRRGGPRRDRGLRAVRGHPRLQPLRRIAAGRRRSSRS